MEKHHLPAEGPMSMTTRPVAGITGGIDIVPSIEEEYALDFRAILPNFGNMDG